MRKPPLRSLTEAERDRLFRELGFLAYVRLWRTEAREAADCAHGGEHAVARAGEVLA